MKRITFYEKPGCQGNARQKKRLESAGCELMVKSILSEAWSRETLRPFFGGRSVSEWFNTKAPAVKCGDVNPDAFDEASALNILLDQPILIRRPLIEINGQTCCGFDELVLELLGISESLGDFEVCQQSTGRCD